jgi:hypothetical protein
MQKRSIAVIVLFAVFLPALLYGQQQKPASLAELDSFLIETAIRLDLRMRGLPQGTPRTLLSEGEERAAASIEPSVRGSPPEEGGRPPRIGIGSFTLPGGGQVPLGNIWKNGILDTLTNVQNRNYILRDTASANEYLLSGVILEAGNTVRITTRVVKTSDSSLVFSWNSDLAKTPFVLELLGR